MQSARMFFSVVTRRRAAAVAVCAAALLLAAGCGREPGEPDFRRGLKELERGNIVRARRFLERAARARPADAVVRNHLGLIYWELNLLEEARSAFESSHRLAPDLFDAAYNLGVVLTHTDETARALELLETAATLAAEDPRPLQYVAHLHGLHEEWEPARTALRRARERAPENVEILTALARAEFRRSNVPEAVRLLEKALGTQPDYPPALYNLAVICRDAVADGKPTARRLFERYLQVAPDGERDRAARLALEALREPAPATAATDADAGPPGTDTAGPTPPAAQAPSPSPSPAPRKPPEQEPERPPRRVARTPPPQPTPRPRAQPAPPPELGTAREAIRRQEYDRALITLKAATKKHPDSAALLWLLAELYDRHLGNRRRAADAYAEYARRFPRTADAQTARRRIDTLTEKTVVPPEAVVRRTPSVQNQRAAVDNFNRGQLSQQQRRYADAIRYYRRAVEFDPAFARAFYNLGTVHGARRELTQARDAYLAALRLEPKNSDAHYNLALVYRSLREYDLAIRQLELLLRMQPGYANAHFALGQIHAEDKRAPNAARPHFEQYLALAPSGHYASRARQWLRRRVRQR